MKNKRIKYQDFANANQKLWMNTLNPYRLSNEDFERYDKICKLYRKQNRFNIFSQFNGMYKEYIPYGKKCLNVSKFLLSFLILLTLCLILMIFYKFMAIPMLCMMPFLIILIFLQQSWHEKYETNERNWEYNKKYNPNFERERKLKRILNV